MAASRLGSPRLATPPTVQMPKQSEWARLWLPTTRWATSPYEKEQVSRSTTENLGWGGVKQL